MTVEVERRLFTVDEINHLIETGFSGQDERYELINGELIRMAPIGSHHQGHVDGIGERFRELLGRRVSIRVRGPVELGGRQRPEPDMLLLRRREDHYVRALPTTADVLLLIEVSDSTLAFDRQTKALMYAQAGVTDYWIVNLGDEQLLVFREPTSTGYASVQTLDRGDSVTLLVFPDLTVDVGDILI